MRSKQFPEMNVAAGSTQEQYSTVFCNDDPTTPGIPATFFMEMDDDELQKVLENRGVWVVQITNGEAFAPMNLLFDKPEMIKHDLSQYSKTPTNPEDNG